MEDDSFVVSSLPPSMVTCTRHRMMTSCKEGTTATITVKSSLETHLHLIVA